MNSSPQAGRCLHSDGFRKLLLLILLWHCFLMVQASSMSNVHHHHHHVRRTADNTDDNNNDNNDNDNNTPMSAVGTSTKQQQQGTPYELWEPAKIKETLYNWVNFYPDLVRLTTAQTAYNLPTAGKSTDCPYDDDVDGCKNYILTIQDFVKHPDDSTTSNQLPEVLLSGELHGNERVGPTAVMEAANLLLQAAACEAKPHAALSKTSSQHSFNDKSNDWQSQLKAAKDCRKQLEAEFGMDAVHRKWLARIVATRRIVIVPTANALGYYRNRREEDREDPNRDFPYDIAEANQCMKTIAGRTLNEIFREHMFQLSLTFHGGMEVVGYEWGAPTWLGHLSPDDTAQSVIGSAYSRYGGSFATSKKYNYGTMNDLVYFVRGGFEDWAYAGSWDPDRVISCQPDSFGGYDAEKTKYNNSTLRVFNMLVETSNQKNPTPSTLGTSYHVFDADTAGNGHVSRNIRLSLLATDAVQPYVAITGVNDVGLTDDVVPLVQEQDRSCQSTKAVMVPGNQQDVQVRWTVGGAFDIDETQLWFAKWDDVPQDVLNCVDPPTRSDVEQYFTKAPMTSVTQGTGFFSQSGPSPVLDGTATSQKEAMGPIFQATLDVSTFNTHDKLVLVAVARVDQAWKQQPADFQPKVPPQSHIVNARTNPEWHHESAGKVIQGRLDWFSLPLTMVVGDYKDSVGTQAGREVGTVELSNRFGETTGDIVAGITPTSGSSGSGSFGLGRLIGIIAMAVCCVFLFQRFYKSRRRRFRRLAVDTVEEYQDEGDEEEYGMPRGGYSDQPQGNEVELKTTR